MNKYIELLDFLKLLLSVDEDIKAHLYNVSSNKFIIHYPELVGTILDCFEVHGDKGKYYVYQYDAQFRKGICYIALIEPKDIY